MRGWKGGCYSDLWEKGKEERMKRFFLGPA